MLSCVIMSRFVISVMSRCWFSVSVFCSVSLISRFWCLVLIFCRWWWKRLDLCCRMCLMYYLKMCVWVIGSRLCIRLMCVCVGWSWLIWLLFMSMVRFCSVWIIWICSMLI